MMIVRPCPAAGAIGPPPWRRGGPAALLWSLVAVVLGAGRVLAAEAASAPPATPATSCAFTTIATARVQRVVDGRTFVLADGREVRLAGIETTAGPSKDPGPGADPGAGSVEGPAAALRQLIGENEIFLKQLGPASDRYGRLLVHAFMRNGERETSLAREMLARGQAVLAPRPGEAACLRDLKAAERSARLARLGLWGDPRYDVKQAENPAEVLAVRGRFTLVEGKVASVRESGGTIYVNFGRRWTEDFTVTISKRNERLFVAAGLAPQRLQGRRVQIRGVVEERGGPWIEATRPEQIELVD
jgi:endonuclease YncB( thermonuclease family)